MELGGDLHFLTGPLLALLFVGLLGALLRWTYGHQRDQPGPNRAGGDEGMLREVAVVPSLEAAEALRIKLARDGIRANLSRTPDGSGRRILVFAKDEIDAKLVLADRG